MDLSNALHSLSKITELAEEIPDVVDHVQVVVREITELSDFVNKLLAQSQSNGGQLSYLTRDLQVFGSQIEEVLTFIHDMQSGVQAAANSGGPMAAIMRNMLPPNLLNAPQPGAQQ